MSKSDIRFSIVLPCYNEAENLPPLLEGYARCWRDLPAELILVDNGSTDDTAEVLADLLSGPEYAFARTVTVPRNRGYGHGIRAGLNAAMGEIVGFSHADQQCSPEDLFRAFDRLSEETDPQGVLIKGKRAAREPGAMLVTNTMAFLATTILGMRLTDINAQPKVFHRNHLARLTHPPDGIPFDLYVLYKARKAGLRIVTIPVIFGKRGHGQSKWAFSIIHRYRTILNMIGFIFSLRFSKER